MFKYSAVALAVLCAQSAYATTVKELAETQVKVKSTNPSVEVTAQELEQRQVTDMKGALQNVAGVSVSNVLRYGQKTYVRGVEDHAANITIDGVRQDGQLFHHASNQFINTSMLKAVSVELGASSVLSGYGANVGAIRYETKNPDDLLEEGQAFGVRGGIAADDATEYRQVNFAGYGRVNEQLSLLTMIDWNQNGDIETPTKTIVSKHSKMSSATVKAVYDFDEKQQLILNGQYLQDEGRRDFSGEKPGSATPSDLHRNSYERDTCSVTYRNESDNPLLNLYVNAYYNQKTLSREREIGDNWIKVDGKWKKDGISDNPQRDYHYETLGLDIRNESMINGTTFTYGLESYKSEQSIDAAGLQVVTPTSGVQSKNDVSISNGPTATLVSLYGQAEFKLGSVTVVPGLRYDNYKLGGLYDLDFSKASPKLAATWDASDNLQFKLGYGRLFKGPALPEVLMIKSSTAQGDDVAAETGNHYEFNVTQNVSAALGLEQASWFANLYQFNIDDRFHPTKNTSLNGSRYDFKNKGFEVGFSFAQDKLSGFINASYNDGEEQLDEQLSRDDRYSGTHEFKLGLTYQLSDTLKAGVNANLVKHASLVDPSQSDDDDKYIEKPGYGVTHLWLSYQPASVQGLQLNLAVDNLFDKTYQNHRTFGAYWGNFSYNDNEVGRNIRLAANYQF